MIARSFVLLCSILPLATPFALQAEDLSRPVPACPLTSLEGGKGYDLQQLKGKVIYIDFWASWCASCAKSFPYLNQLHEAYKDKGLQVIGINMDESGQDAKAFLNNHAAQFSVAADASKQCAANFAMEAMPATYLIDKKGFIRHVHLGFRAGETADLQQKVEQLLAER